MVRSKDDSGAALERLREFGLRYPGAHTKSPWPGHLDLAVNDKTFAYMSVAGEPLKISCKLPRSSDAALGLPFTTPTGYGLGKSGWVTATFPDGARVPVELLEAWIDESYRAQAPKRLSAKAPAHGVEGSVEAAEVGSHRPRAAKKAPSARGKAPALHAPAKQAPSRAGKVAAGARSTVKQAAPVTGSSAASPARSVPRRSTARAATPAVRVGARSGARGAAAQRAAAPTRAGKRASVSQRAASRTAKRTAKKQARPSA